jgi:hypothetical protein
VIYSKDLEARSPIAGAYLKFLILRGQQWPTVGQGAEAKGSCLCKNA